jgi:DNA-binding transcriptional LysR family regulator
MDWDKLRIFHAVADAGSFTHAGDTLNLSQSAVSRQISTLEESLGIALFHRHARGLVLTEEGEILHKAAKKIFGQLAVIEGQLADSRQLPEGPLKITAAPFLGSTWLAPKLGTLKDKHPDIQLTLLLDDRILNLSMREADAAVRLYKSEQPDLVQRHLTDIRFHVCGSKEYLAKHGTPKNMKELREHVLIGYPENVPAPFADSNWLFRVSGVDIATANNIIMMNSLYGIYEAVQAGVGLASLPDYLVRQTPGIKAILPDLERTPVGMYFVYPEERKHSQRISIFRDFLLQTIEETKF